MFRTAESKSRIDVLGQTVKEEQQLHDTQTDIARAPARQRVLVALRGCLEDSARRQADTTFRAVCFQMDTFVLRGITRVELAAALGPPTWCQRPDTAAYVRSVGNDCAPEQTPVWSSEPASARQADSCVNPTRVSAACIWGGLRSRNSAVSRSASGAARPEWEVGLSTCQCSATVVSRVDWNMATGEITGSFKGTVSP